MSLWKDKAYVNGSWTDAESGSFFQVTNPANGKVLGKLPDMNDKDTEKALKVASEAFVEWGKTTGKVSHGSICILFLFFLQYFGTQS
jgi:NAD-dependent aldehyde dehydrogenases